MEKCRTIMLIPSSLPPFSCSRIHELFAPIDSLNSPSVWSVVAKENLSHAMTVPSKQVIIGSSITANMEFSHSDHFGVTGAVSSPSEVAHKCPSCKDVIFMHILGKRPSTHCLLLLIPLECLEFAQESSNGS